MRNLAIFFLFVAAAFGIDKPPRFGVLGSRYNYPTRGLIGAYALNEGSGTTLVDYSARLGYRNGGASAPRCGNLTLSLSSGTIPFGWNPAPLFIANRPLREGNGLNDIGIHLGGTYNATRTESDPQNDHIPLPSCSQQIMTAVFITKPLSDASDGTSELGGGFEHPLIGGNQNDDPIGFYTSEFQAPIRKDSLWGVTSGRLDFLTYWGDHGQPIKYLHCQGDDKVMILTVANGGLRLYCDGVEVVYMSGLSNISRLFPGSVGYIGRDDTTISPNYNFNQPLNKNIQWMSFHSVALNQQEILQATYALKYEQRKYAKQKPNLIVVVGDSVNDECYGAVGPGAGQCTSFNSPNGTTLSAGVNATATTLAFSTNNVISYDATLGTGGFVRIDQNEIVKITSCTTATSATSCTVQRGCTALGCSGTGTSHSTGAYVQTAWPIQLRAMLKSSAYYVNGAISFFDDEVMHHAGVEQNYRKYEGSEEFAKFDLAASGIYGRKILIGGECINAIGGGRSAAQIEFTHTLWALEHYTAGWEVFPTTCTPMGGSLPDTSGGTPPDGKNAIRAEWNSWIRANWRQSNVTVNGGQVWPGINAAGFIDTDTDPALGSDHCEATTGATSNLPPCASNANPTIPFLDSVSHLTSVGAYRFALLAKAALNSRGIE